MPLLGFAFAARRVPDCERSRVRRFAPVCAAARRAPRLPTRQPPNVSAEAFRSTSRRRARRPARCGQGVFEPVCSGARRSGHSAGASRRRRRRGGGGRRRSDAPAARRLRPPRETWYAEPQKVFDNLYFVGQTEFSVVGDHHVAGHHPARRDLRLLGRGRSRRGAAQARTEPGGHQVRDRQPRPPRSRRRREVPAGEVRRAPDHVGGRLRPARPAESDRGSRSATWSPPTA